MLDFDHIETFKFTKHDYCQLLKSVNKRKSLSNEN